MAAAMDPPVVEADPPPHTAPSSQGPSLVHRSHGDGGSASRAFGSGCGGGGSAGSGIGGRGSGRIRGLLPLGGDGFPAPSVVAAVSDHSKGTTSFGFGIRTEDLRQPSYRRADPNYIMLTPTMEHFAQDDGKRPVFQANPDSGSYDHLPKDLRPIDRII